MKITFLPKTRLGKWSVALMILGWLLFIVGSIIPSKYGYSGIEIIIQNPLQAIITFIMFAAGIASSIIGLISVIRYKERSIVVFFAVLSGFNNVISFFGVIINIFLK